MDADSFDIVLGGQTSASFGTDTSIGPTGGNHVLINSDGVNIKNSSTTYLSASADGLYMTGSRAIAFLGIGNNLDEAEKVVEESVCNVKGKVFHRKDIGTKGLIEKRIKHVKSF